MSRTSEASSDNSSSASLLRRWCASEELASSEMQELWDWTVRIALTDYRNWRALDAVSRKSGVLLLDAARDYVAVLFGRHPENYLAVTLEEVLSLDDAGLLAEYKAIVVHSVRQELYKRFKEIDETGFSIQRNMMRALRHDRRLKVWPEDKPRWVALATQNDLRLSQPEVTREELLPLVIELSAGVRGLPKLIHALVVAVADDSRWRAAVSIYETIFEALREAAELRILAKEAARMTVEPDEAVRLAIQRAIESAMMKAQTIVAKYVDGAKLHKDIGLAFLRATKQLLEDLGETGMWQGDYCAYLKRWCPELTQEDYRDLYKARFDHVALSAERTFLRALGDELGD